MRLLFAGLAFALFTSCAINHPVPKRFKKALNCYDGQYTGLDTLINIHGYYSTEQIRNSTGFYGYVDGKVQELGIDTSYYNFILFDDGIFIGDIQFYNSTVEKGLTNMAAMGQTFNKRAYYQGTYMVSGDTLKIQYSSPGYANVWNAFEVWYRILDNNTLHFFYRKHLALSYVDKNNDAYQPKFYDNASPSKFVYLESIPESSSWLLENPWFYCSDSIK